MQVSIKVDGLRELEAQLLALGAELGAKTLRSALSDAAEPIKQYMLDKAPVGEIDRYVVTKGGSRVHITPGFLRSRIKKRTQLNKKGVASRKFSADTTASVRVGVYKVPYLVAVEFGTSRTRAQPFVRPALPATKDQVLSLIRDRLKHRIHLALRRKARSKKA